MDTTHLHGAMRHSLAWLIGISLTACGGGGGSGGADTAVSSGAANPWPSSGRFSVVLKPSGSTTASPLSASLSLVHPATPLVEYVMDGNPAPSSLGVVLRSGSYDATTRRVVGQMPVAYLDAPDGALRTTPLAATGARPAQLAGPSATLCPKSMLANDYAHPYDSELVIATPGVDGACGTADDEQLKVNFSSSGAPTIRSTSGLLGYLRTASTGQPRYWLQGFPSGTMSLVPTAAAGGPSLVLAFDTNGPSVKYAPVQNLDDLILYTKDGALEARGLRDGAPTGAHVSALVGPDGWQSAGNDANASFVYLNSSTARSGRGTWRILKIDRNTLAATTLATGTGSIMNASALPGAVYATVLGGASGTLSVLKVDASTGAPSVFRSSATSASLVSSLPGGLNVVTTSSAGGIVDSQLIDDAGTTLFAINPGIFYGVDGNGFDLATSSMLPSGIYFTSISQATGFGGSPLTRFDSTTRSSQTVGRWPTGDELGGAAAEPVFVNALLPDQDFGGTYASRMASGQLITAGSAVYTFVPGRANSLVRTTSQVR